jgi:hypothetical protein
MIVGTCSLRRAAFGVAGDRNVDFTESFLEVVNELAQATFRGEQVELVVADQELDQPSAGYLILVPLSISTVAETNARKRLIM